MSWLCCDIEIFVPNQSCSSHTNDPTSIFMDTCRSALCKEMYQDALYLRCTGFTPQCFPSSSSSSSSSSPGWRVRLLTLFQMKMLRAGGVWIQMCCDSLHVCVCVCVCFSAFTARKRKVVSAVGLAGLVGKERRVRWAGGEDGGGGEEKEGGEGVIWVSGC